MTTPVAEETPTSGKKSRKIARTVFAAAIVAAVALGAYSWYGRSGEKAGKGGKQGQAQRSVPVSTVAARTADVNVYLTGLGSVTALNTVTVKSRVDGQLMRVLFREGDTVRSGAVLAEIDPRPYNAQLLQAEGQLAKDEALLANAKVDLERYKLLAKQDSIAKQQLDTQAALVRQYEGALKADQGSIANAKLQLVYSRITAPVGGKVGLRQVDAGNIVHASDQNGIVVITQVQPINVLFTIPEDSLQPLMAKMRGGAKLKVDAWNREGNKVLASGYLQTIDNQIDPATGTVKLKAIFDNKNSELFPSQFVNAKLLLDVKKDATVVPAAAIQRGQKGTFVYAVNPDQTAAMKPVTVGPADGDNVSVEGLNVGDQVVVEGADKLRDGAKVELQVPGGKEGGRGGKGPGGHGGPGGPAAGAPGAQSAAGAPAAEGAPKGEAGGGRPGGGHWGGKKEAQ